MNSTQTERIEGLIIENDRTSSTFPTKKLCQGGRDPCNHLIHLRWVLTMEFQQHQNYGLFLWGQSWVKNLPICVNTLNWICSRWLKAPAILAIFDLIVPDIVDVVLPWLSQGLIRWMVNPVGQRIAPKLLGWNRHGCDVQVIAGSGDIVTERVFFLTVLSEALQLAIACPAPEMVKSCFQPPFCVFSTWPWQQFWLMCVVLGWQVFLSTLHLGPIYCNYPNQMQYLL